MFEISWKKLLIPQLSRFWINFVEPGHRGGREPCVANVIRQIVTNRYAAIALLYSAAIVISSWLRRCIVFLETLLNMSQMSGLLMAMVASKKVFKGGPSPGAPAPGHVLPGAHKFPCPSCTRECSELCLVRTVYITSTKCAYCNALLAGFIYNTSAFCNRSGALNLRHVQCIRPTPVVLRSSQTMNHPFHDFHFVCGPMILGIWQKLNSWLVNRPTRWSLFLLIGYLCWSDDREM